MPGILTIAKKEFVDHVSDKTFLLSFAILLIAMIAGALYQVQFIRDWNFLAPPIAPHVMAEGAGWKFFDTLFTEFITGQLSLLGVLVAISLSFNSINKERSEGSLKVLLSYPIHRDKLILGKLLGSVLVLSLAVAASMTISFSVVMFSLSIRATADFLLRIVTVTVMGIVLLTFFLCIGTAVSTVLRDTAAILVGLLLIATILRYETIKVVADAGFNLFSALGIQLYGRPWINDFRGNLRLWRDPFYRTVSRFSPVEAYLKLSERLFNWGVGWETTPWVGPDEPDLTFQFQLYGNLDLVAVQILFTVVAFIICYVLFTRRDVA